MVDDAFMWPSLTEIRQCQEGAPLSELLEKRTAGFLTLGEKIWIPDANNLRVKICVIRHCGIERHFPFETTRRTKKDTDFFLCDKPSIPRPLGELVHGTQPNEVLHYNFLYIQKKKKSSPFPFEYILALKDDFSGFIKMVPADAASHFVVADALVDWYSRFGMPSMHVSDPGSHFKDK